MSQNLGMTEASRRTGFQPVFTTSLAQIPQPAADFEKDMERYKRIYSRQMIRIALFIALVVSSLTRAQTAPTAKKLIEFGWDEPDTAFIRLHIREMEKHPFHGVVFDHYVTASDGAKLRFIDHAWGKRKFTQAEFQPALDDLKATEFKQFTDNFLRFDVTPGDVDWFDDFSAILENAKLAAHLAKNGKARGILFDVEPYVKNLWDYRQQRDKATKSFEDYSAQARTRGKEFMQALQGEFPDIRIFLTFAYSLSEQQTGADPKKLANTDYALLPAFLNGMLDVANPGVKIIDGHEMSYAYKDASEFDIGLKRIRTGALPFAADAEKYQKHISAGFGIWMDEDWRKYGWDVKDFARNYFSPEAFEKSVKLALERADEYVWIYTEKPMWWTPPAGQPKELPAPYEEALKRAAATGTRGTEKP